MGMSSWKDQYRLEAPEWPMEEFLALAGETLERLNLGARDVPNERLVRYYAAEGTMSKPDREGREVRYTYSHLVEFLVTRMLLDDGWPLAKISQLIGTSDLPALEQMLPDDARYATAAQIEVAALKRGAGKSFDLKSSAPKRDAVESLKSELFPGPQSASQTMMSLHGGIARGRSTLGNVMKQLGLFDHQPAWRETLTIELTPWCRVDVDKDEMNRLPSSSFDLIGEALVHSLREHRLGRRERK